MYHIAFEILLLGLPKVQILGLPLPDVPPSSASHRRSHAQASPATPPRFSPPIHHRTRSLRSHPSPLVSLPSPIPLLCKPTFFPLPSNCHARLPANQYCYHLPSQSSGVQRPVHFAAPHFVYVYLFFQTTIRRYFIPFPLTRFIVDFLRRQCFINSSFLFTLCRFWSSHIVVHTSASE